MPKNTNGGIGHNSGLGTVNPAEAEILKKAIREINDSMTRVASEKQLIKDIVNAAVEKTNVPKKLINKAAKVYFQMSIDDEKSEADDFQRLYELLFGNK